MNKRFITIFVSCLITSHLNSEQKENTPPSFTQKATSKNKKVKNVEEKVVDTAKEVFDLIADITSDLVQWGKCLSDKVFKHLKNNNKQELSHLLQRLEHCQKELLEIQKKIDTLS